MTYFRRVVVVVLVLCIAPLLSVLIAGGIASLKGCQLHEGFANPCVVAGRDIGELLYVMGMMVWPMLITLPVGVVVLAGWMGIEIFRSLRRRGAPPA